MRQPAGPRGQVGGRGSQVIKASWPCLSQLESKGPAHQGRSPVVLICALLNPLLRLLPRSQPAARRRLLLLLPPAGSGRGRARPVPLLKQLAVPEAGPAGGLQALQGGGVCGSYLAGKGQQLRRQPAARVQAPAGARGRAMARERAMSRAEVLCSDSMAPGSLCTKRPLVAAAAEGVAAGRRRRRRRRPAGPAPHPAPPCTAHAGAVCRASSAALAAVPRAAANREGALSGSQRRGAGWALWKHTPRAAVEAAAASSSVALAVSSSSIRASLAGGGGGAGIEGGWGGGWGGRQCLCERKGVCWCGWWVVIVAGGAEGACRCSASSSSRWRSLSWGPTGQARHRRPRQVPPTNPGSHALPAVRLTAPPPAAGHDVAGAERLQAPRRIPHRLVIDEVKEVLVQESGH